MHEEPNKVDLEVVVPLLLQVECFQGIVEICKSKLTALSKHDDKKEREKVYEVLIWLITAIDKAIKQPSLTVDKDAKGLFYDILRSVSQVKDS